MTTNDKLSIEEAERLMNLYADNGRNHQSETCDQFHLVYKQLSDTMRENERLLKNMGDYQMALELAPHPVSKEWLDSLALRINNDRRNKESDNG